MQIYLFFPKKKKPGGCRPASAAAGRRTGSASPVMVAHRQSLTLPLQHTGSSAIHDALRNTRNTCNIRGTLQAGTAGHGPVTVFPLHARARAGQTADAGANRLSAGFPVQPMLSRNRRKAARPSGVHL